ncbi:MAG: siroheme synthase [Dehalococcoidia bacterium]|nr:siroheme synthase [Dehalococcoidia bacterium]
MAGYYPIYLKLDGKKVVVVGGGEIAERKVATALECGAIITVVSPEYTNEIKTWGQEGRITIEQRPYADGDIAGCYMALVCTDDHGINQAAADEARKLGVLVNTADDVDNCDFIAPAIFKRGGLTLAVSTSGLSPAMARRVREELEEMFPPEYAELLSVLSQVRATLRGRGIRPDPEVWQQGIDEELKELVRQGELWAARERLTSFLVEKTVGKS